MNWKYKVADLCFEMQSELQNCPLDRIGGFDIFHKEHAQGSCILKFDCTAKADELAKIADAVDAKSALYVFEFEGINCAFYNLASQEYLFVMLPPQGERHISHLKFQEDGKLIASTNWDENKQGTLLRFSLWMAFGISMCGLKSVPIHSSVIKCAGKAYLFLGESGTGKSTHTRLWLENVEGAELLNDDCPIVRSENGKIIAHGGPWSGKTPCYKDEAYPIGGIVRLSQAPENKARRLSKLEAFSALYPSCPPAFAKDEALSEMLCSFLSDVIAAVPVYHLACLPDRGACEEILRVLEQKELRLK